MAEQQQLKNQKADNIYNKSSHFGRYTRPTSFLYKRAYNALYKDGEDVGATLKNARGKAKSLLSGKRDVSFKIRLGSCKFTNPKSKGDRHQKQYARNPFHKDATSAYDILRYPLDTEKANICIEDHNTLVFIVRRDADKNQIKKAFNDAYQVKPTKVNTLITPLGLKKAYIKLPHDVHAVDLQLRFKNQ